MRFRSLVALSAALLFSVFYTAPRDVAYAQAASPVGFGSVLGSLVSQKAASLGFNAADPRIAATIAAMGAQAAAFGAAAAASAGSALSAVPWMTVAAAAAVGGFLGGLPVAVGVGSTMQWQFNKDGSITVSSNPQSSGGTVAPQFQPVVHGQPVWDCGPGVGADPASACTAQFQGVMQGGSSGAFGVVGSCTTTGTQATCTYKAYDGQGNFTSSGTQGALEVSSYTGASCSSGLVASAGCLTYVSPPPIKPPPPVTEPPGTADANTSAADQALPVNPQLAAATADALWSDAAAVPGYAGLPYPVSAPVSSADAAGVRGGLGASWPTVGGVVGGAGTVAGGSSTTPFSTSVPAASNPASSVPVATNPGSGAQVNLGPDPGIGSPSMESIPTASQILAPILGMLPDLRTYGLPAHSALCPEPSVSVFGQTITVTAQCTLAEQFRSQIHATFVMVFSLIALFIVLTA